MIMDLNIPKFTLNHHLIIILPKDIALTLKLLIMPILLMDLILHWIGCNLGVIFKTIKKKNLDTWYMSNESPWGHPNSGH